MGDWFLFYLLGQNIDSGAYKVIQKYHPAVLDNLLLSRISSTNWPRNSATDLEMRNKINQESFRGKLLHREEGRLLKETYFT